MTSERKSATNAADGRAMPTELEGCVLGIVWSRGPCTAYAARRVFLDSPSPYWSGSAGAVYPLLARLERRGLVRTRTHATGQRSSRLFAITAKGRRALERWLGPPLPGWMLGPPADPLRTRIEFLPALPVARQVELLAEAEREGRRHLAAARERLARAEADGDRYAAVAVHGALTSLEARVGWLAASRRRLSPRR